MPASSSRSLIRSRSSSLTRTPTWSPGPSGPMEGEAGAADVRHHRVALRLHHPRPEDALVEARRSIRVRRLEGGVVEPWHASRQLMEVVLIVNPFASGVSEARVEAVEQELRRARRRRAQARHGTAEPRCRARRRGAPGQALVVFSGDGGFNEVLNGVSDGVLGRVPSGRRNERALAGARAPRDPVAAAGRSPRHSESGASGGSRCGRVNGRRFGFSAGIGLDARSSSAARRRARAPRRRQASGGAPRLLAAARLRQEPARKLRAGARGARPRAGGLRARGEHRPATPTQAVCPLPRGARRRGSSSGSTSSRRSEPAPTDLPRLLALRAPPARG